jgi:hypothetical protein
LLNEKSQIKADFVQQAQVERKKHFEAREAMSQQIKQSQLETDVPVKAELVEIRAEMRAEM